MAEYAYDALGRRIEQIVYSDGQPSTTRRYYMGKNWQVLTETDGASTPNTMAWYIYGNYIDEVLRMTDNSNDDYYYLHDHLYSPVALLDDDGDVVERYEYDAYGACRILDDEYDPRSSTQYANPYLFTGRGLDILDTGSLTIQYNRNRYYDPETGRWLTHDLLGITPNPPKPNFFDVTGQYKDGMNLYEYTGSAPVTSSDAYGLSGGDECGIVRYKNKEYFGHEGVLIGSQDFDFGPKTTEVVWGPGECPWSGGGPGRDYEGKGVNVKKVTLVKRKIGRMTKWGPGDAEYSAGKPCCCVTCQEIKECIKGMCRFYNTQVFNIWPPPATTCRSFVRDVKKGCCLKDKK